MKSLYVTIVLALLSGCTAMVLGGGSSSASVTTSADASISSKVRNQLATDGSLSAFDISVRTNSGAVVLVGRVDSHVAREHAGKLAKQTDGVRSVTNQIVVE